MPTWQFLVRVIHKPSKDQNHSHFLPFPPMDLRSVSSARHSEGRFASLGVQEVHTHLVGDHALRTLVLGLQLSLLNRGEGEIICGGKGRRKSDQSKMG